MNVVEISQQSEVRVRSCQNLFGNENFFKTISQLRKTYGREAAKRNHTKLLRCQSFRSLRALDHEHDESSDLSVCFHPFGFEDCVTEGGRAAELR